MDDENVQAGETLPAVMGARVVGTLHRAVSAAGRAKFLGRVADEADDTVAWREEQFKCELAEDAKLWGGRMRFFYDNPVMQNASAVITGLDVPDSSVITKIIIPDTIEDLPVVGIADGVFKELPALEDVLLPDGIITIGAEVFESCSHLKSINFPKSLKSIGYHAFSSCGALKQVSIADRIGSVSFGIWSSDNNNHDVPSTFYMCPSLSLKSKSTIRKMGYEGSF